MKAPADLVLGAADGYEWTQIEPFLGSLRATGFDGDVRLFVPRANPDTVRRLREAGVKVEQPRLPRVRPYDGRLTSVWWRGQTADRSVIRELVDTLLGRRRTAARLLGAASDVEVARFGWYLDFLARASRPYRNVMLTDIRDVVFLGNPFDFDVGGAVHMFAEDEQATLGQNVYNRGWLLDAYGGEALARIADRPIVCSGVTIGACSAVVEYLRAMVDHLARLPRRPRGVDQGVHNYLLHNGLVPQAKIVANRAGTVLTVGLMAPEQAAAAVRERAGEVKVVHQYDRHPEVQELLSALTGRDLRAT